MRMHPRISLVMENLLQIARFWLCIDCITLVIESAKICGIAYRPPDLGTPPKTLSLQYNRIEQCFSAHNVHSRQQYETILFSLSQM